jgi:hypothetical protein
MLLAVPVLLLSRQGSPQAEEAVTGLADPQALLDQYKAWEVEYEKSGGDRNIIMGLGWSKGLSDEHTNAYGFAKMDLVEGVVMAEVSGLPPEKGWDLWLVQDKPGAERTVLPEQGDTMIKVGAFKRDGTMARLQSALGSEVFSEFRPDFAFVTPEGKGPDESRYLVGTLSLFHDLYNSAKRGRFGMLDGGKREKEAEERGLFTRLIETISPTAEAQTEIAIITDLIAQGRQIFKFEEFRGNTRTCETCHRETNNLTIDPAFIAGLSANDPLFVGESPPLIGLENPPLMRKLGLILENVDGFERPGVLRGVPHTLAMATSLRSSLTGLTGFGIPATVASGTPGFAHATGWSGDGSPTSMLGPPGSGTFTLSVGDGTRNTVVHVTTGSLRDFAIGAVRQHFPKTLNRVIGVDFRLPTLHELNALEAFQLSTGRQQDLNLATLSLKNPTAAQGKIDFNNAACNTCHGNAGAIDSVTGFNENFNTGVETISPGPIVDPSIPRDGGFGNSPCLASGECGNRQFNTTTVVEAADTGPFFHSNLAFVAPTRIEEAVGFYRLAAFTQSPAGAILFGGQPLVNNTTITTIGAFLRVINARENIIQSVGLETRALSLSQAGAQDLLGLSIEELNDAISVLVNGNLHPTARQRLLEAIQLDQQAMNTADQAARNQLILQAICKKQAARSDMENGFFPCLVTGGAIDEFEAIP